MKIVDNTVIQGNLTLRDYLYLSVGLNDGTRLYGIEPTANGNTNGLTVLHMGDDLGDYSSGGQAFVIRFGNFTSTSVTSGIGSSTNNFADAASFKTTADSTLTTIYNALNLNFITSAGFLKSDASGNVSIDTNVYALASSVSGFTSGSGTVNRLSKWSASQTLTDSNISDSGSLVTVLSALTINSKTSFAVTTASNASLNIPNSSITPSLIDGDIYATSDEIKYYNKSLLGVSTYVIVKAISTSNIATLSGTSATIDGQTLAIGDIVCLQGQTTKSQNGIYVVASSTWSRASSFSTETQLLLRDIYVLAGTTYKGTWWMCGNKGSITIGTTSIIITQIPNGISYGAGYAISSNMLSASAPLSYNNTTGVFTISQANTSTAGYLSAADWNTFNNKQAALTNPVTGTGTSGFIVKFTGATTVGNGILFEANNRIEFGSTWATLDTTTKGIVLKEGYQITLGHNTAETYVVMDQVRSDSSQRNNILTVTNSAGFIPTLNIASAMTGTSGVFSSTLTATKFITTGGTASQFVKGNGDLDGTAYAPLANLGNYLPLAGGQMTGRLNLHKNGGTAINRSTHGFGFGDNYTGLVSFWGSEANAINALGNGGVGASDGPFIYGYAGVSIGYSSAGLTNGDLIAALRTSGLNVYVAGTLSGSAATFTSNVIVSGLVKAGAFSSQYEASNYSTSATIYTKILTIALPATTYDWFTTNIVFNQAYGGLGSATIAISIQNNNGALGSSRMSISACEGYTPDQFIFSATSTTSIDIWLKGYGNQQLHTWSFINERVGSFTVTRYSSTAWQTTAPTPISTASYLSNAFLSLQGGTVTGTITSTGFIKSGGTSSQFLKADGSVDANAYSLTSHGHSSYVFGDNNSATSLSSGTIGAIKKSGFYSGSAWTDSPVASTWTHLIHTQYVNDAGTSNTWSFDIAANFGSAATPGSAENYYVRCIANGTPTGWRTLWHSGNLTQTSLGGPFQPLENQRLSTGNSPTFSALNLGANAGFQLHGDGHNLFIKTTSQSNTSTGLIAPTTTTANNPIIGRADYRWYGMYAGIGDFNTLAISGNATISGYIFNNAQVAGVINFNSILSGNSTNVAVYASTSVTNGPSGITQANGGGMLYQGFGANGADWMTQLFVSAQSDQLQMRTMYAPNTWRSWKTIWHDGNFNASSVLTRLDGIDANWVNYSLTSHKHSNGARNYFGHYKGLGYSSNSATVDLSTWESRSINGLTFTTLTAAGNIRIQNLGFDSTGGYFVVSFWAKGSVAGNLTVDLCDAAPYVGNATTTLTTSYQKVELYFNTSSYVGTTYYGFLDMAFSVIGTVYIKNLMIERGTNVSDYRMPHEDLLIGSGQGYYGSRTTNVSTFDTLLRSGFYDSNSYAGPFGTVWTHLIRSAHTDPNNAKERWSFDISAAFANGNGAESYALRVNTSAGYGAWRTILHSGNFDVSRVTNLETRMTAVDNNWANYVTIATDQTITGAKTFTNNVNIGKGSSNTTNYTLAYFDTERPWRFAKYGTGGSTQLHLIETSGNKTFVIGYSSDAISATHRVMEIGTHSAAGAGSFVNINATTNINGSLSVSGSTKSGVGTKNISYYSDGTMGTGTDEYMCHIIGRNAGAGNLSVFTNGPSRTAGTDGGPGDTTIRSDSGNLRLGGSAGITKIFGTTAEFLTTLYGSSTLYMNDGQPIRFGNGTWNTVGDDVRIGDINEGATLGLTGANSIGSFLRFCSNNVANASASVSGVRIGFDGTQFKIEGNTYTTGTIRGANRPDTDYGTTVFAPSTGSRSAISNGTNSVKINRFNYSGFMGYIGSTTSFFGITQDHENDIGGQLSIIAGGTGGSHIGFFAGTPTLLASGSGSGCYQSPKVGHWNSTELKVENNLSVVGTISAANFNPNNYVQGTNNLRSSEIAGATALHQPMASGFYWNSAPTDAPNGSGNYTHLINCRGSAWADASQFAFQIGASFSSANNGGWGDETFAMRTIAAGAGSSSVWRKLWHTGNMEINRLAPVLPIYSTAYSVTKYKLINTLPVFSAEGNGDVLYWKIVGGGWVIGQSSICEGYVKSRGGSLASTSDYYCEHKGGAISGHVRVQGYRNADGSLSVYLVLTGTFIAASVQFWVCSQTTQQTLHSIGADSATVPTGTKVFDTVDNITSKNLNGEYWTKGNISAGDLNNGSNNDTFYNAFQSKYIECSPSSGQIRLLVPEARIPNDPNNWYNSLYGRNDTYSDYGIKNGDAVFIPDCATIGGVLNLEGSTPGSGTYLSYAKYMPKLQIFGKTVMWTSAGDDSSCAGDNYYRNLYISDLGISNYSWATSYTTVGNTSSATINILGSYGVNIFANIGSMYIGTVNTTAPVFINTIKDSSVTYIGTTNSYTEIAGATTSLKASVAVNIGNGASTTSVNISAVNINIGMINQVQTPNLVLMNNVITPTNVGFSRVVNTCVNSTAQVNRYWLPSGPADGQIIEFFLCNIVAGGTVVIRSADVTYALYLNAGSWATVNLTNDALQFSGGYGGYFRCVFSTSAYRWFIVRI